MSEINGSFSREEAPIGYIGPRFSRNAKLIVHERTPPPRINITGETDFRAKVTVVPNCPVLYQR